jgi:uncharacterized protein YecT (DUF1311 family)
MSKHNHYGILLINIILALPSYSVMAASFDCNRATTEIEKIICDKNNYLSEDDERLNNLFLQLVTLISSQAEQLKQAQQDWLKQRDLCLQDKVSSIGCLAQKYEERLASLFVIYLQTLVAHEEKAKLARLIAFPLEVKLAGNNLTIKNEQEFLANYSQIMTKTIETALLNQDPEHLRTAAMETQIGQGEIKFKGNQIIAIDSTVSSTQPNPARLNKINHPIDQTTTTCINKNYSSAGMITCFNQAYDQWDKELNTVYSLLLNNLKAKELQALQQAQTVWIKYKNAQFELFNQTYDSLKGTMWTPIKLETTVNLIKNRVLELQTYLDDLRESGKITANNTTVLTTKPKNRCDVWAFIIDTDPTGLNIRSAPRREIISRVPYNDYEGFTSVHIIDAKAGWLRIDQWEDFATTVKVNNEAWIYGKLAGTFVKGYQQGWAYAYADPSKTAQTQGRFLGERGVNILGCKDKWLLVEGDSTTNQQIEGWLPPEEQCPNAITTCP